MKIHPNVVRNKDYKQKNKPLAKAKSIYAYNYLVQICDIHIYVDYLPPYVYVLYMCELWQFL